MNPQSLQVNHDSVGTLHQSKANQHLLFYRHKQLLKPFLGYTICFHLKLVEVEVHPFKAFYHWLCPLRIKHNNPNYHFYIRMHLILLLFLNSIHRTLLCQSGTCTNLSSIIYRIYRRGIPNLA